MGVNNSSNYANILTSNTINKWGEQLRITLISDAWEPQVNGVVTTLKNTSKALKSLGHEVQLITPDLFRTWPCPGYPDVGLAFLCGPKMRPLVKDFDPDAIHILTEGPVGYAVRRFCKHYDYVYTSSFHSQFPDYFKMRIGFPLCISRAYLKWFHHKSERVMVASASLEQELAQQGYKRLVKWSRGVDTELFRPRTKNFIQDCRPVFLYAGRVAIEKNLEAFLKLDLPGSKYIIGDGPQRKQLEEKYPEARFMGYQRGVNLARYYAAADVFVFPSQTDTFGNVMLEALACGTPVAAFPVAGPKDIITDTRVGCLHNDLQQAAFTALILNADACREFALNYSWVSCTRQLLSNLVLLR